MDTAIRAQTLVQTSIYVEATVGPSGNRVKPMKDLNRLLSQYWFRDLAQERVRSVMRGSV